jgi:hypothetical protein
MVVSFRYESYLLPENKKAATQMGAAPPKCLLFPSLALPRSGSKGCPDVHCNEDRELSAVAAPLDLFWIMA